MNARKVPTIKSVIADLERVVTDLCALKLYDDAEDINRTIRYLTEEAGK